LTGHRLMVGGGNREKAYVFRPKGWGAKKTTGKGGGSEK